MTAELRPRGPWEASDFGVRLMRRDAAVIYRAWFAITLPLVLLALLGIWYSPYPGLATFAYWWLEPVADGPILRIISRRLFGESVTAATALKSAPKLAWQNRIFLFTPYRFHFARSIAMPVTQLEGLAGARRRRRTKVLNQKIFNYGVGVTAAYEHLLLALYLGVLLIGFVMIPGEYQDSIGSDWMNLFLDSTSRSGTAVGLILFYAAQSALQPWFVGAGFGLYINCRTELEAWDIEVAFRRMVQRRAGALATAALAVLVLLTGSPQGAFAAQDGEPAAPQVEAAPPIAGYWDDEDVSDALTAVLDDEALRTTQEVDRWISRKSDSPSERSLSGGWFYDLIEQLGRFLSILVETGLWIGAALLVVLLYLTRNRWMPYLDVDRHVRISAPRIELADGTVSAESLPADIPAAVLALFRSGEVRKAASLLYRGCVFCTVDRYDVRLPPSATEGECLRAVERQVDVRHSGFFARIVAVWIRCAYGARDPDTSEVEALCREWGGHFETVS